jgi:hypothetical protein
MEEAFGLFNILFPHLPWKTEEPSIRIVEVRNGYFTIRGYRVAATRTCPATMQYTLQCLDDCVPLCSDYRISLYSDDPFDGIVEI